MVNRFTYIGSNISSTERDVNIHSESTDCYRQVIDYMEI